MRSVRSCRRHPEGGFQVASDPVGSILLLLVFLLAGACARAAETAASLGENDSLEERARKGVRSAARALRVAESAHMGRLAAAWIVFLAGFLACALFWLVEPLTLWLSGGVSARGLRGALAAAMVLIPAVILYYALADLIPARVARKNPPATLERLSAPAYLLAGLCFPVHWLARLLASAALRPLNIPIDGDADRVTEQEIRMLVDIGEEKGAIEADEKQMIENIFEFNNMSAEDCMVHRKDITFIDLEDSGAEILKTIRESGLSRFPVYEEDVDNVVGILTTRDYLLNECLDEKKPLRELIRPAYFVPESVRTDVLFSEMQKRKQHMAIVLDEYGGTSGLITLEDLLEEIVGNIYDEFDPQAEQEIVPLGEGRWRVSGSAELDVLSEALGVEIDADDECDTLGGLVFSRLNEIPSDGARPVVECFGLRVSVEEILDRRVEWALVERLQPEKATDAPKK